MDEHTNAGMTAIANTLGHAMMRALDDELSDDCWRALTDEIRAEGYRRRRRKRHGSETPAENVGEVPRRRSKR
jgi:hypothetical protein